MRRKLSAVALALGFTTVRVVAVDATSKPEADAVYKNPNAPIEDRINDLIPRMTLDEKVAQLIQGDIGGWMNMDEPFDNTLVHNRTGLIEMMRLKGGSIWAGYPGTFEKLAYAIETGQRYLMEESRLGIPALIQTEGLHGFINNGTIWPSPIALACSFNRDLLKEAAATFSDEAEPLGFNHMFAPVLDLGRELRFGRVEEGFSEDRFLAGDMGLAFVEGIQAGSRRNTSSTAVARVAATCKHFAAFGSPQGGLNMAPVAGGERELQTNYIRPFNRACQKALSIMTAYNSYDGIPATGNKHLLVDILREQLGFKYWLTSDSGAIDLLYSFHATVSDHAAAAKTAVELYQGEMGGGKYTYLTLPDQVRAGEVDEVYINQTVEYILRTKFSLGLFENPYPYKDWGDHIRTEDTRAKLLKMERETIVLLENRNNILPLSKNMKSLALIGPSADQVIFGDYVFPNASDRGMTPLDGFKKLLKGTNVQINYAEGCKLWSGVNEKQGFSAAVEAAQKSDVAVVVVGTWSRDQYELWRGSNATTGEHVDIHDLGLVGAQKELVQTIIDTKKPTIVVFVAGKPVAEESIVNKAEAVISQFYPGELGGLALAEVIFGDVNPSGKLSVSWPRDIGTTPAFYNYLKGGRSAKDLDAGRIFDDGTLQFGHQYVLSSPVPLWSFGHGLSYTTFTYSDLKLESQHLKQGDPLRLSVTVSNTGGREGKEVVQVYISDVMSSVVTAVQQLVGFEKVYLGPGRNTTVSITVPADELGLWNIDGKWVVEPGVFEVRLGSSQTVLINSTFTVVS